MCQSNYPEIPTTGPRWAILAGKEPNSRVQSLTLVTLNNVWFLVTLVLWNGDPGPLFITCRAIWWSLLPLLLNCTLGHLEKMRPSVSTWSLSILVMWQDPKCSSTRGGCHLRNLLKVWNHMWHVACVNHSSLLSNSEKEKRKKEAAWISTNGRMAKQTILML